MANLKDISRQIKSVKNTQKTTKAMKLVSTAKLKRAQQLSDQTKSYAIKISNVLSEIAHRISEVQDKETLTKAFVLNNNPKIVDLVFLTSNKGLCGGFNIATIKEVRKLKAQYESQNIIVRLRAAGRKGIDYFNFQNIDLIQESLELTSIPTYDNASNFIKEVYDDFNNGATDKVILIYNGFFNMLSQKLKVKDLLPISFNNISINEVDSILEIEPDDNEVLEELTAKYVDFNIYYSLIDSLTAEHSARRQAMDNASNNAKEKVDSLTVEFNKARQASITTELIEIISGVEALK
jgi:F-type H+-transporting ATPase subunit gamma